MAPNRMNAYGNSERMWKVAVVACFKVCVCSSILTHTDFFSFVFWCILCTELSNITVPSSHIGLKLLCLDRLSFMGHPEHYFYVSTV